MKFIRRKSLFYWICLLLLTSMAANGQDSKPATYDVRAFGAKGDGKSLDTGAINRAIETAAAGGGGMVRFPAGSYLTFSIHLKSNITLYLDQGSTIVAADPVADHGTYDAPEPNQWDKYQDFGHSHFHNSLIWGEGLVNVSILGPGLIWGKGLVRANSPPEGAGNKSISLKLSRNVIIRDVSILHGGHFAILATGVDNFTIDNIKVDTNRDGIDVDSCRNVRISNVSINSPFDDGICLKSDYALGFPRATENVTISNSQVSGYDEGSFLDGTFKRMDPKSYSKARTTGRVKFGTESNGGFKNITISNIVFDYSRGFALEEVDGGTFEDVTINNVTMRDIVNPPFFIRLGNRARGPKETTPVGAIRRLTISNVIVYDADSQYGSIISGIPDHEIEDLKLNNIQIFYKGGGTAQQAGLEPPEKETVYPEPDMFGDIPAYGFFVRHVKGLEMSNVELHYMQEDMRPAFLLNDVQGALFRFVKAQHAGDIPTFSLQDVQDFTTYQTSIPDTRIEVLKGKKRL